MAMPAPLPPGGRPARPPGPRPRRRCSACGAITVLHARDMCGTCYWRARPRNDHDGWEYTPAERQAIADAVEGLVRAIVAGTVPDGTEHVGPSSVYAELEQLLGDPRGSGTYRELEQLLGYTNPTGYRRPT